MKLIMTAVMICFALSAFADVTVTEKTDETVSVSYFSNGRIAVYENNQLVNITDLKNQMLYGFSAAGKIYFKSAFKDMIALSAKGLSEIPAEQKTAVENSAVVIKKNGKGEYGGYQCDRYELSIAGTHAVSQICVSPELRHVLLKEIDAAGLKNWMRIMDVDGDTDPLRHKMDEITAKVGYIVYERTVEKIPGVPDNMSTSDAYYSELQSVSLKPIDGKRFSIPAGYKRVSMEEALGTDE